MLKEFNQTTNYEEFLPYKDFSKLFINRINTESSFCKIYDKTKVVTDIKYNEFGKLVLDYAVVLQSAMEIIEGEAVAVKADNTIDTMALYTAILICGATIIPMNPFETDEYTQKILSASKADLYIEDAKEFLSNISDFPDVQFNYKNTSPDHAAAIFYTSGTTGNPKGVVLTLGNLLINSIATQKVHALNKDSIHFSCLPICHVNAFSFTYFTNFLIGSSFIYQSSFFPLNFWNIIKQNNVEIVSSTPHIINLLNQDKRDFDKSDFPKLKYFVSASAPLSTKDIVNFRAKFKTRINQAYGLSETVNFSLTIPSDLSEDTYTKVMEKMGTPSAGVAIFGNSVEIHSPETNSPLEAEKTGEIVIRGWNVFDRYYDNEEETQAATTHGVFHTGDLGYFKEIDGHKFIFINGRKKEIVKRKGILCHLSELDLDLRDFFKEISFSTCGFDNEITGEEIGLVVSDFSKIDTQKLEEYLLEKFPAHKRPKIIIEAEILQTSTLKPKRNAMKSYFSNFNQARILDKDTVFVYNKQK
jgi:acyl-CoA synthetase (AMP-forming)/AMP-acid ligase II